MSLSPVKKNPFASSAIKTTKSWSNPAIQKKKVSTVKKVTKPSPVKTIPLVEVPPKPATYKPEESMVNNLLNYTGKYTAYSYKISNTIVDFPIPGSPVTTVFVPLIIPPSEERI